MGDVTPGRIPARIEGMDTGYAPLPGHEPGGVIVNDAQKRALANTQGVDNGKGTSTDLYALGYKLDSIGQRPRDMPENVETSTKMQHWMASNKDKLAQAAIRGNRGRLGRRAMKEKISG